MKKKATESRRLQRVKLEHEVEVNERENQRAQRTFHCFIVPMTSFVSVHPAH